MHWIDLQEDQTKLINLISKENDFFPACNLSFAIVNKKSNLSLLKAGESASEVQVYLLLFGSFSPPQGKQYGLVLC